MKNKDDFNVGDIVVLCCDGQRGVITFLNSYQDNHSILLQNGDIDLLTEKELEKTGKTIDIHGILDQLGEEMQERE